MPKVTPFRCIRPKQEAAELVAALPYDVYNRKEACAVVAANPLSFLAIDRAETQFADTVDTYAPQVYQKAKELLHNRMQDGTFLIEETPCYYIYELTMGGHTQTGIVGCSSIEDYENGIIKKHENTREDKEIDRIHHVDVTNTHTGPIFLVYRAQTAIDQLVNDRKHAPALYDFLAGDGICHRVWIIDQTSDIRLLEQAFAQISCTYIADGHHRLASAVRVGQRRRAANPNHTGQEEYNRFLSVLFPENQMYIMPYNRVVRDLNGLTRDAFLERIEQAGFQISYQNRTQVLPTAKGTFGMCLADGWYLLTARKTLFSLDPVKRLDVSILQDHLLAPILDIGDPRTDKRIDFVGGIRGLSELEKRISEDMRVGFSLYPTSIEELLQVADAGLLMPPKSTWFEPKLRSGLFLHSLDDAPIK